MFLLDTNVLSEIARSRPHSDVLARFRAEPDAALFTSAICIEPQSMVAAAVVQADPRLEAPPSRQLILGTDKRNPVFAVDEDETRERLMVFWLRVDRDLAAQEQITVDQLRYPTDPTDPTPAAANSAARAARSLIFYPPSFTSLSFVLPILFIRVDSWFTKFSPSQLPHSAALPIFKKRQTARRGTDEGDRVRNK